VTPVSPSSAPAAAAADTASYDLGLLLGNQLADSGLGATLSIAAFERGLKQALGGVTPQPQQRDLAHQLIVTARAQLAARNTAQAREFLTHNAREPGIQTLPSGLQYRILVAGDPHGAAPGPTDDIELHYRLSLMDGKEIDRSDQHPQSPVFRLGGMIPGWREALTHMHPGAKWQLFVPPELGYGNSPPSPIPPGALLRYELQFVRIVPRSITVTPSPGQQ
jgi:FKBP-type peptidyl-prolyl cis-trans isomerase